MLKDLGFQSEHVIDPTLMLDRTEWEKYMSKRLIREEYVFVYIPYNIKDKDAITRKVREIANKGKLKVVAVTSSIFKEPIADYSNNPMYKELDANHRAEASMPDVRRGRLRKLINMKGLVTAMEATAVLPV